MTIEGGTEHLYNGEGTQKEADNRLLPWALLAWAIIALPKFNLNLWIASLFRQIFGYDTRKWGISTTIIIGAGIVFAYALVIVILYLISRFALKYDPLKEKGSVGEERWFAIVGSVIGVMILLKVTNSLIFGRENQRLPDLNFFEKIQFVFQYYKVELLLMPMKMGLVILTIAFAQKAGEGLFRNYKVPYGGIFLAISLFINQFTIIMIAVLGSAFRSSEPNMISQYVFSYGLINDIRFPLYGVIFLMLKKDIRKAYTVICITEFLFLFFFFPFIQRLLSY